MSTYPAYVSQTLARAREEGQWSSAQADAAALCFDMLALFPDCREASELVYELFCEPWTVYDNRVALQQNIDEWDDRPWQQRRRLALSFRFMSRWEGKYKHYSENLEPNPASSDVHKLLAEGKMELLGAYCLGDEECTDYAWAIFTDALSRTNDPRRTLFWLGFTYADLGFFADSAEILGELCSRFDDAEARRLLAEVLWWRDNASRIPWLPPAGAGSHYDRMMGFIDPYAPTTQEQINLFRKENQKEHRATYRPTLSPQLAEILIQHLPDENPPPTSHLVDGRFLDEDDGQPGEPAEWVKKQIEQFKRWGNDERHQEMIRDMEAQHRWTRNITPPPIPRCYDPNEPPFNPKTLFGAMDDEADDDLSLFAST